MKNGDALEKLYKKGEMTHLTAFTGEGKSNWGCYRGCTWEALENMEYKECPNCGAPDVEKE